MADLQPFEAPKIPDKEVEGSEKEMIRTISVPKLNLEKIIKKRDAVPLPKELRTEFTDNQQGKDFI